MTARTPHSNVRIKKRMKPLEHLLKDQISIYQSTLVAEKSVGGTTKNSVIAPIKAPIKHYLLPTGSPRKQHNGDTETLK